MDEERQQTNRHQLDDHQPNGGDNSGPSACDGSGAHAIAEGVFHRLLREYYQAHPTFAHIELWGAFHGFVPLRSVNCRLIIAGGTRLLEVLAERQATW
jgi:hypothetical protein